MEDVVRYDLDLGNGRGQDELEEPQSANAGKHPLSKIKSTMNSLVLGLSLAKTKLSVTFT